MNPIDFRLRAWEYWTPDHNTREAETLPALLRRRITPIGRHALNAVWGLPQIAQARLILSSRHGEFSRTASLLGAIASGEDVSPADFTLSVHHALIGLLSISLHNRRGHSAVAAGRESFCFGLLEALACLKENPAEPVVLIHFDESLPAPYDVFNDPEQPMALALILQATGEGEKMQFDFSPAFNEKPSASHAGDFLNFLISGAKENISVGEDRQWRWKRHADR